MTALFAGRRPWAVAAALALVYFLAAFAASREASLTWDEPSFIASGYAQLTQGEFRFNPSHPPLSQDLVAFPLLFMNLRVPPEPYSYWAETGSPAVSFGHAFVFRSGNDPHRIAFWSRLPVLLAGTALVLGVFLVGRRHFGNGPALVGTAVAAFSPDLLAHGGLATEDMLCAATMFAAVAVFQRALDKGGRRDWVGAGLVTGVALLAKYTALLLGPIYVILYLWGRRRGRGPSLRRAPAALGVVAVLALLVVGAGYNATFDLARYWNGFRSLYGDLGARYTYYLLGEVSPRAFPHYCLMAFLIKTPLPALLLIGWAIVDGVRKPERRDALVILLVPALVILGASLFDRANFGVRRVLPAYPFLFALTSMTAAGGVCRTGRTVALALVAWCGVEAAVIHPHPLSYFNEAAGGPARGPYLLEDSNLDWGQDLPALARWQRTHPEARPLRLSYFGTAPPAAYGVDAVPMSREEMAHPLPGWYAVSAHLLVNYRKEHLLFGADTDWLSKYHPVDRAGWSIWIYHMDGEPAP